MPDFDLDGPNHEVPARGKSRAVPAEVLEEARQENLREARTKALNHLTPEQRKQHFSLEDKIHEALKGLEEMGSSQS